MSAMIRQSTSTAGATGSPGCVYSADAPRANATSPPMVSSPPLVTVSSSTKRITASPMSSRPAMLSGRLPKPMKARISAKAPRMPVT